MPSVLSEMEGRLAGPGSSAWAGIQSGKSIPTARATMQRVERRVDLNASGGIEKPIDLLQPDTMVGVYRAQKSKARRPDVALVSRPKYSFFLRASGSMHGGLETTATQLHASRDGG